MKTTWLGDEKWSLHQPDFMGWVIYSEHETKCADNAFSVSLGSYIVERHWVAQRRTDNAQVLVSTSLNGLKTQIKDFWSQK